MMDDKRFRTLANRWRRETGSLSVIGQKLRHPAVEEILVLGRADPSLVFDYYSKDGSLVWSRILTRITGTMPDLPTGAAEEVAPGFVGWDVRAVQQAWLRWGREHGYLSRGEAAG